MNFNESVNYIHSLLRFGVRPGLNGMDALLHLLNNPHKELSFVHVAGTNGKGSVSTAVSNVLICAGYKVGLYTSPYVSEFLERIQFCGTPVDKEVFCRNTQRVKEAVGILAARDVIITEFEALTAIAFLCFKELMCDVVVLEVGLGGRLDATNVIDTPLVNIITSLSIDHSAILGETIKEIAYEKCGTIKKGSTVVSSYGQPDDAMDEIINSVNRVEGKLVVPDINSVSGIKCSLYGTSFVYKGKEYSLQMNGLHQVKNMTTVIEACEFLKAHFSVSDESIKKGLYKTVLPARIEVISRNPLVVLDGGHNEDGARVFFDTVSPELREKKHVFVVAGMMADKEVEASLKPLISASDCFIAVTPDNPRAMTADSLSAIAEKYCKKVLSFDSPVEGVSFALSQLGEGDALCVVGSLYLAGEVRGTLLDWKNQE